VVTVMTTWQRGRHLVTARRAEREGSLPDFVDGLHGAQLTRVPGLAVYPHPTKLTAPLALRANAEFNHVLHERVVIVSVLSENLPHVPPEQRVTAVELGHAGGGVIHLSARFGFHDEQDIPELLDHARERAPELDGHRETASYYLSRMTIERGSQPGMSTWRKRLFIGLAHNAANPALDFHLPVDRTVVMGSRIEL
jgi:KUP system potassium uptake protein